MGLEENYGKDAGLLDAGSLDAGRQILQRSDGRDQMPEVRRRRSEDRDQRSEIGLKMNNLYAGSIIGVWILIFGISASGCVSEPSRNYDKEFVNTYAELTLLYEKQKMEKKEPDSTYQVMVKEFFESKGWKQEEFKKQAEDLSQQPHVWKLFISDVTAAIDSIKNLK